MPTLADMKARIAAEIVRGDLTTQIANAISDAIKFYQSDRFYFNEPRLDGEPTFYTVAGQSTYGAETLPVIGSLFVIDYLIYRQGGSAFKIDRAQPLEVDLSNQTGLISGPPDSFAYAGQAITLYPVPDTVYPVSIFGEINVAGPATDDEVGNVWMNDAEQLIRCRAKFELAVHVTRNATMIALMSPDEGAPGATYNAYQNLKKITAKRVSTGRTAAMPF